MQWVGPVKAACVVQSWKRCSPGIWLKLYSIPAKTLALGAWQWCFYNMYIYLYIYIWYIYMIYIYIWYIYIIVIHVLLYNTGLICSHTQYIYIYSECMNVYIYMHDMDISWYTEQEPWWTPRWFASPPHWKSYTPRFVLNCCGVYL